MMIRSNFIERRKYSRYKVKKGPLVGFLRPRLFKWGKPRIAKTASIVDISKNGLAFEYVDRNMWSPDFSELTLAESLDAIKVDKVPFKAVSDYSVSRIENFTFLRRCGVKFGELTPEQKAQLHYFIIDNTVNDHPKDRRAGKDRRQAGAPQPDGAERRKGRDRREQLLQ